MSTPGDGEPIGILTDTTKCIGCNECVHACRRVHAKELAEHGLHMEKLPRRWQKEDGLSPNQWTSILRRPGGHYVRKQCRHCLEPACVASCLVGALQKTPEGAVVYDESLCIGCRYCMMACPYGVPRYNWEAAAPYIWKCTLCHERMAKGASQPACTEACPTGATIFGKRSELLKIAHERLRQHPDKYQARVYGDQNEIGGACVLYISDIPLEFLSFGKDLGERPITELSQLALGTTPYVFLGVGAALLGLNWVIGRREKLRREQAADVPAEDKEPEQNG